MKKKYHPPKMTVYGDLKELTEATGSNGASDSGGYQNPKTR
jgi:hypothetical protein